MVLSFVATYLGAVVGVAIVTKLASFWFFTQDAPLERAIKTTAVAVSFACLVSGYAFADGGPYTFKMFPTYLLTFPVVAFCYHFGFKSNWFED